jgi:hypothetical protein
MFENCANLDISNKEGFSIFEPHESAFASVEVIPPPIEKKKAKKKTKKPKKESLVSSKEIESIIT